MAGFDGNGNYIRSYSWTTDKANGVNITASRFDTEDNGFAAGLTLCVTRDGQGKMAANFLPSADLSYSLGSGALRWTGINGFLSFASNLFSCGAGAFTPTSPVSFSATAMTVNCALSNVFATTFTGNVTTAPTISNPNDGQTINWIITQDGTGGRTMTWPTTFKWPGGNQGVLSTAANAVDVLIATYNAAATKWFATLSRGFA